MGGGLQWARAWAPRDRGIRLRDLEPASEMPVMETLPGEEKPLMDGDGR